MFKNNLDKLRSKMNENDIELSIITDDDNLYYFTGYHDFLHMDFNRPTILLVPKDEQSIDPDKIKNVMNVNFLGVIDCVKSVEDYFKNKKSGHISIVSSPVGILSVTSKWKNWLFSNSEMYWFFE